MFLKTKQKNKEHFKILITIWNPNFKYTNILVECLWLWKRLNEKPRKSKQGIPIKEVARTLNKVNLLIKTKNLKIISIKMVNSTNSMRE
jgi:hypothetical protein